MHPVQPRAEPVLRHAIETKSPGRAALFAFISGPDVGRLDRGDPRYPQALLAANLAASLARAGARVVAVDTDIEGANLHTWLGVPSPRTSLADFVAGRVEEPIDLIVDTPLPTLGLLAATHGNLAVSQPEPSRRVELLWGARLPAADELDGDDDGGSLGACLRARPRLAGTLEGRGVRAAWGACRGPRTAGSPSFYPAIGPLGARVGRSPRRIASGAVAPNGTSRIPCTPSSD